MNRAAFVDFNQSRLAAQYETWGEPVILRSQGFTGCASAPRLTVLVVENGDEVTIERTVRLKLADFDAAGMAPPKRWEQIKLGDRTHCIAGMLIDEHAGEYLLQLANPQIATQFS